MSMWSSVAPRTTSPSRSLPSAGPCGVTVLTIQFPLRRATPHPKSRYNAPYREIITALNTYKPNRIAPRSSVIQKKTGFWRVCSANDRFSVTDITSGAGGLAHGGGIAMVKSRCRNLTHKGAARPHTAPGALHHSGMIVDSGQGRAAIVEVAFFRPDRRLAHLPKIVFHEMGVVRSTLLPPVLDSELRTVRGDRARRKSLKLWSGRRDSNPRRPAWEIE